MKTLKFFVAAAVLFGVQLTFACDLQNSSGVGMNSKTKFTPSTQTSAVKSAPPKTGVDGK